MKKLDFLPNRQNKYSIRKFTVGTASILLGTILISGATEEAKAAETTSNDTTATASDSMTKASNTQSADTSEKGTTTTNTQTNTTQQPTDSLKDASTEEVTQTPSASTSEETKTTQEQAPKVDTTQENGTDNKTSTAQAPDAQPAPETKSDSNTDQSEGGKASTESSSVDSTSKQSESNTTQTSKENETIIEPTNDKNDTTQAQNTNVTSENSDENETVTSVPDVNTTPETSSSDVTETPNSATLSAPLTEDITTSLNDETNQTQALTDYLTKQNNLSPEAAQQVVDGMNVDLTNATSEEISNALIASYLQNSQNSPESNPVANTSRTESATTQSKTSPTSNKLMASRAAVQSPATQVSTWDEYVTAMNDTSVSNIQLTGDITANKVGTLNSNTGRKVTVDGSGHTLDTGNYYVNAPVSSGSWDVTLEDATLKTNHSQGFINFAPSTSTNNVLTLRDITHTGTNIINDTENASNVDVNLEGNVTSTSKDNVAEHATIGAKNIHIAPDATVDMTLTGLGSAFRVSDNGSITTGAGSEVNVDVSASNPWGVTNGNTAFKAGNNVTIQLGEGSTTNVKGQNIFDFGNGGTLNTGVDSTVNVDQKGNGNIVHMGTDSTFEVAKDAKFIAYSDGHRVGDWKSNNLIGLNGNSQILVDENATLFLDAKNHQWNPDTQTQVGTYNDLVNINATGNQTALLHVADNATLDLRTDNRNYYAEVISIPLGGTNPDRRYVFDNAYYVNLQKTSKVTSGQSPNGQKPNLIFMDPGSPGYFQWNGSYIVKTWDPMVFSDPEQHADATDVWEDVVDLRAEQEGFSTGVPTYNEEESTLTSTSGTPLDQLNLNYAQRVVLISNNSDNPEAVPPETTTETIPPETTYEPNPDSTKPVGDKTVITPGKPGEQIVTTEPGKDLVTEVTTPPVTEVVGVNNQKVEKTPIPHETINRYNPDLPVGAKDVLVQEGKDGSTETTTTYDVDPKTGELTNPHTETSTTPAVDEITEYGPVEGDTIYQPDPNLPYGETETTPGEPGDPNDPDNPPTDTVIGVGNVEENTDVIPHDTTYVGVDEPVGYTNIETPGKDGSKTTTTTYEVDPKTGELINPSSTTETTNPVTQVNQVGTKKVTTESVPYETITRYNPDLPEGTQNEVQPGITGQTETTTTYTVNPDTGELEKPTSNTVTTVEKQDRIIEVGKGTTSVVNNPIPHDTTYEPNPDSTKPVGDKTVITPGKPGEQTVTTEPGKDPVTEVTTPPVTEVVGVNNQKVEKTPIPHETINRYNPDLPVGAKDVLVQEGKDGSTETTTTYDVDPKTGELTNPRTETSTTPAVDEITEYGPVEGDTIYQPDPNLPYGETETTPGEPGDPNDPDNPPTDTVIHVGNKVVDEKEVPYETIYRDNPNLPVGTEKEIQAGVTGKTQTITTYDVDPKTGELTNPRTETVTVAEKQDRIIERGTGSNTPTQPEGPDETPAQPEGPSETPTQPEGPDETPAQPEGPSETPAQPEGPSETPTQPEGPGETPTQLEEPGETSVQQTTPATSDAVSNDGSGLTPAKEHEAEKESLPNTGENTNSNGTLFGSLFAGLGAMLLFGKKRRRKNEK